MMRAGQTRIGQQRIGQVRMTHVRISQVCAGQVRLGLNVWPTIKIRIIVDGQNRINDGPNRFLIARSFRKGTSDARHKKHYRGQTT